MTHYLYRRLTQGIQQNKVKLFYIFNLYRVTICMQISLEMGQLSMQINNWAIKMPLPPRFTMNYLNQKSKTY